MTFLRPFAFLAIATTGLGGCAAESSVVDEADVKVAKSTLTFPLVAREWNKAKKEWSTVELASLNAELESANLAPFARSITIGAKDSAAFMAVVERLEKANERLGRKIEFQSSWDPSDYAGLCYNGSVASVINTVEALRDSSSAFPEYMGIAAYRYGKKKIVRAWDGNEADWLAAHLEENPGQVHAWKKFDTSSNVFLLMADGGPQGDGTELFAAPIPKCTPCATFPDRFDKCLGDHAEGCFDIFATEIGTCCTGSPGQSSICAEIEEHLNG